MKKYFSIFLVFVFLFVFNFNVYNQSKAYASVVDSTYAKGVMTVLSMLVGAGLVTYNNTQNAKALAVKLWDSASDSFKQALNNANTLKNAVFTFEAGQWLELINNLKTWYNQNFSVPYYVSVGDFITSDVTSSYDGRYDYGFYYYYKRYIISSGAVITGFLNDGGYFTFNSSNGYVFIQYGNGNTWSTTVPVESNKVFDVVTTTNYDFFDKVGRFVIYRDSSNLSAGKYTIYKIDVSRAYSVSDGSVCYDTSLNYDGTGVSIGNDVLNLDSDTLANNVADTNVKVPTYDNTLDIDANISNLVNSLLAVDANTYANSLSQTNILSNILSSVQSVANVLTDGLVGDISKISFDPIFSFASDLTKKFPFCIPWDINRVLSIFDVPQTAPVLTIALPSVPNITQVQTYDLNLNFLDNIIGVIRTLEIIAFDVMLFLASRKFSNPSE